MMDSLKCTENLDNTDSPSSEPMRVKSEAGQAEQETKCLMCLHWFSRAEVGKHLWKCQAKMPCLNRIVEVKSEIKDEPYEKEETDHKRCRYSTSPEGKTGQNALPALYTCECGHRFRSQEYLLHHNSANCQVNTDSRTSKNKDSHATFQKPKHRINTLKRFYPYGRPYPCMCGLKFRSQSNLDQHKASTCPGNEELSGQIHPTKHEINTKKNGYSYLCECGHKFKYQATLDQHKAYKCSKNIDLDDQVNQAMNGDFSITEQKISTQEQRYTSTNQSERGEVFKSQEELDCHKTAQNAEVHEQSTTPMLEDKMDECQTMTSSEVPIPGELERPKNIITGNSMLGYRNGNVQV